MSTTMFVPPEGLPSTGSHPVHLGRSMQRSLRSGGRSTGANQSEFHALRYNFKPGGIDDSRGGSMEAVDDSGKLRIERLDSQNERFLFAGDQQQTKKWECVLIYDEETQSFTLENLHSLVNLTYDQAASKSAKLQPGAEGSPISQGYVTSSAPTPTDEPTPLALPRRLEDDDISPHGLLDTPEEPQVNGDVYTDEGVEEGVPDTDDDPDADEDFLGQDLAAHIDGPESTDGYYEPGAQGYEDAAETGEEDEPPARPAKRRRLTIEQTAENRHGPPRVNGRVSLRREPTPSPPVRALHLPKPSSGYESTPVVTPSPSPAMPLTNGHVHSSEEDEDSESDSSASETGSDAAGEEEQEEEDVDDDDDEDFLANDLGIAPHPVQEEDEGEEDDAEESAPDRDPSPLARHSRGPPISLNRFAGGSSRLR